MEKLGIDTKLIIIQIVNFGLLVLILKKVLYKPVLAVIKKREEYLKAIGTDRDKLDVELEKLEKKKRAERKAIQAEKKKILDDARKKTQADRKKILAKADSDAKDLLENTKRQLIKDRLNAKKEIQKMATEMAVVIVEKVLKDVLEGEAQRKSVQVAIRQLDKVELKNGKGKSKN